MPHFLLATRNAGKLREIRQIVVGAPAVWHGLADFPGVGEAEETGTTFAENARLKALHAAAATGLCALADDSGLEVDVLGGAPGVQSARFAGVPKDDAANNRKLIELLAGVAVGQRTARFRCAMALARDGQIVLETQGVLEGVIVDEPRGENGFGYDPHFWLPDAGLTVAQLPSAAKNARSHRGQALGAMLREMEPLFRAPEGWSAR